MKILSIRITTIIIITITLLIYRNDIYIYIKVKYLSEFQSDKKWAIRRWIMFIININFPVE